MRTISILSLALLLVGGLMLVGCSDTISSSPSGASLNGPQGGMGVTPGGSQSFTYIRTVIESGGIPTPENYLVESIYSEYDLPVAGPASEQRLTVNSAYAWAADDGLPGMGLYQQLGFSSNAPDTVFERPALNLSIVLDRSGSMGGTGTDGNRKMDIAKRTVDNIIDVLDEGDILSIVLFDDRLDVLQEPTPVTDQEALHDLVATVTDRGSTDMDVGLRKGYDFVQNHPAPGDRDGRVVLITDALPNTGNDSDVNFRGIVSAGAAEGVGLTAIGVGIDFDQSLIEFIATQEGGNYYYMNSFDEADGIIADEFEYMTNPFLYDFVASVTPGGDCQLAAGFGFPGDDPSGTVLEIETMFPSSRRGGIFLSFATPSPNPPYISPGTAISEIDLSYRTPEGDVETDNLSEMYDGPAMNEGDEYYSQYGVHVGVVLTRMVLAMQSATEFYVDEYDETGESGIESIGMLERLVTYLGEHDAELGDTDLQPEVELVQKLIANMRGDRSD